MLYCNDLNSLSVLSLYEGELLGVVDKLYFSEKLKKLIEIELINENGVKLILPTKNIYKIGKNAITVKNNQMVYLKTDNNNLILNPINSKAYSINGEYLGIIKEINFNEKFITQKISFDNNQTIGLDKLASCGKNTVIFNTANAKINKNKFKPENTDKILQTNNVEQVDILSINKENKNTNKANAVQQNPDFLIGRKCVKDIFNFNNEILIKANTLVNKRNLKEIKKFGKLRELMLYSK